VLKIQYSCSKKEANVMIRKVRYVLEHLPLDVREMIDDQCLIILLGKTYGYSTSKSNKHVIILNFNEMFKDHLSQKEQWFIIAHEFAHFYLNHTSSSDYEEEQANRQVISWGFRF